MAKAIDVVDRITLRTGFFLSREPLARLLFLLCVPVPIAAVSHALELVPPLPAVSRGTGVAALVW